MSKSPTNFDLSPLTLYFCCMYSRFLFLLLSITLPGLLSAQEANKQMRSGDAAYENQDFEQAEQAYRDAENVKPDYTSSYNLGNALYKQLRLEEAEGRFNAAISKANGAEDKARAHYNLGNARVHQGKLKEAIQYYKQALKYNPQDEEARHNLAQTIYRMQREQQSQQGENSQQRDEQEQNEEEAQEQQSDQQQSEQQQSEEEQKQQQAKQQESEQQESDAKQEQEQEGEEGDEEQEQLQEGELTEEEVSQEEAERLLRQSEEQEKKTWEKMKRGSSKKVKPKKDW